MDPSLSRNARSRALLAGLSVTVGLAVWIDGGFSEGARLAFAVAAGLTLTLVDPRRARTAVREPAIVALLCLGLLTAVSALWTIAGPEDALRWGLVICAYAAVAAVAAVLTQAGHWRGPLALIVVVAVTAGAAGLVAACLGEEPFAERLGGSWRAGGPYEYPPALAVAQIAALPGLLMAMSSARRPLALAGAMGWAVAACVVAFADSRIALALCAIALLTMLGTPAPAIRPRVIWGATALFVLAGALAHLLVGGIVDGPDRGAPELLTVLAIVAGCAVVWALFGLRTTARAGAEPDRRPAVPPAVAMVLGVAGIALVAVAVSAPEGGGIEPVSGFAHGREKQWSAAIEVFGQRPLAGYGAESYFVASFGEQGREPVLYAHNVPLEIGAELGALGLAALAALAAGIGRLLWVARGTPGFWAFAPAVVALPLASLLDWSWHLAGAGALWAVALGALAGSRATSCRPCPSSPSPSSSS